MVPWWFKVSRIKTQSRKFSFKTYPGARSPSLLLVTSFPQVIVHTVLFALKTLSAPAIIAIVTRELNPKLSGSFHTLTITVHWSWHAQGCHQTLGQRWLDKEDSFINTTALREKPQSWPLMIKTFTWHSHGFLIAFKKWHKKGWRYSLCLLHSAADFFLRLFNCCQSCTDCALMLFYRNIPNSHSR